MTSTSLWRLLWVLVGIVALVALIGGAYYWGMNSGHSGFVFEGPRHGFAMMGWGGAGWWGVIPALVVVFLLIFLFVALITGPDRGRPHTSVPGPSASGGDVERLRELSELHERGRLTDEEFAAAKRKILGL